MAKAKQAVPSGYHTVTAQLTIERCQQALDWYKKALGAEDVQVFRGPNESVAHAEFRIGNSKIMANDPMMGSKGPGGYGGSPVGLWLYVDNADALFERAVAAGAKVVHPMTDQFWGDRTGTLTDPFGYQWMIATHIEDLTKEEMEARGKEFFAKMGSATA